MVPTKKNEKIPNQCIIDVFNVFKVRLENGETRKET